ncbi:hypothetical protein SAMN05421866_0813 [Chryseobacterium oranimense]|uniref:Tetratricopeptide repeat-containing protein n=1 Tax=Chryseobacterium oranimense TaxID=421058 RepID=A0A1M5KS12_9FLAO|nr:hypothetical protein [Chryseobacterium oranimense]SHG55506.1 hypothetical protein SAMN05421866_0813 [Chryseobacterium oranimense]
MGKIIFFFLLCFNTLSHGQVYTKKSDNLYDTVYSADTFSKKSEQDLLQTCNDIYTESINKHDGKGALQSITTIIRVYSELDDQVNVLKRIEEAISLAQNEKDYYRLSLLYYYMGRAFLHVGLYTKARKAFDIGLETVPKAGSKDKAHILKLQHYGGIAMIFENATPPVGTPRTPLTDSMTYYAKKAYQEARLISPKHPEKSRWLGIRARIIGSVLICTLYFEEGGQYLNEAESLLSTLKDKRFMISLYRFKGLLAYNSGLPNSNQKALALYEESYRLAKIYDIPAETYFITDALASLYSEMKMSVPARLRADDSKKVKYEIDQNERQAIPIAEKINVMSSKNYNSDKLFYIIVPFTIIFAGGFIYYNIKRRGKKEVIREDINNFKITNIKSHTEDISQLLQMAKENDRTFYIIFKQVFPEFQNKLLSINGELTAADLELCAYLKLNLQTKEIAMYKNNTVSSIDNKKSRLRKKLNLSSETNLYVWIDRI